MQDLDRRKLWLVALLPLLGALSPRDLWPPDEPRYGQVAREMLATGDWLVPHVNGEPYAEKPPACFWTMAAVSAPFGRVTAQTARLAAALQALGAALLLAALARRWFGDPALGTTAALLFAGTPFVLWIGQRAVLDLPLAFWILLAVERGDAWLRSGRLGAAVLAGIAWALAVLAKGPLGLLLPALALGTAACVLRPRPALRDPGWWMIPALMAGLTLAWALPASAAGGAAYADRLFGQVAGRATGAEGHHVRPLLYYVLRAPLLVLPWSLHALAGLGVLLTIRRRPPAERAALAACAAVALGGFVLLSLVATKREVYLVPLLPFLCLPTAYALHRGAFPRVVRVGRFLLVAFPGGLALVLLALPLAWHRLRLPETGGGLPWPTYAALALAVLLLALGTRGAWRAREDPPAAVRATALPLALALALVALGVLPRLDPVKSYAAAARAAEAAAGEGPVYHAGFAQAPNLLWSLDRARTPEVADWASLGTALPRDGARASVVASGSWWDLWRAAEPDRYPWVREAWRDPDGRRGLVVLTNR